MSWCVHCNIEKAVAPTRLCAECLRDALAENERDACEDTSLEVVLIEVSEPPCDCATCICVAFHKFAYPSFQALTS